MSLIISTGSNLGDRLGYLVEAEHELQKCFSLQAKSNVYESPAVDFTEQPAFLNQVLEFEIPLNIAPIECLKNLLAIEKKMGRRRDIPKGPRTIDLDLLFWGAENIALQELEVPHPRLFQRSFIVFPLRELPYYSQLRRVFDFPDQFDNEAWVYSHD